MPLLMLNEWANNTQTLLSIIGASLSEFHTSESLENIPYLVEIPMTVTDLVVALYLECIMKYFSERLIE